MARPAWKNFIKKRDGKGEANGVRLGFTTPPRAASAARTQAEQEKDGKIRREFDLFKIGSCGLECCQTASLSNSDAHLISVATVSLYTPHSHAPPRCC